MEPIDLDRYRGGLFVYGPHRSGKTTNSEKLRQFFGCKGIIDTWEPRDKLKRGFLHLGHRPPQNATIPTMHIDEALRMAGLPNG